MARVPGYQIWCFVSLGLLLDDEMTLGGPHKYIQHTHVHVVAYD